MQTRIVLKQEQVDSDIPEYEDIFRDDEVFGLQRAKLSAATDLFLSPLRLDLSTL